MACETFSTWTALYEKMLDDLASGDSKVLEASVGGGAGSTIKYHDMDSFMRVLNAVEFRAKKETGAVSFRSYAKQGGQSST